MIGSKILDGSRGPDITDRTSALSKANEVLALFRLGASVPADKIARRLGVQVRYAPFDGDISGMAHIKDGVNVIGINSLHHPNRQRFTLAHELGHIVLHPAELARQVHLDRGSLYRDGSSSSGLDPFEVSANAFASELLMPECLLSPLTGPDFDLEDEDAVAKLAKRFRVSIAAMYFRLHR